MDIELVHRPGNTAAKVKLAQGETLTAEGGAMIAMSGDMDITTTTHKKGSGSLLKSLKRMFGGATPDPAMVELVRKARAAGLHTALLSNSWGEGYPKDLLVELFDTVVISGRVGLRKPDERIYRHTLDQIGVEASRAVFFDDAPVNVDAARAVGMHAFRHTTADDTRAHLATLGVNP